MSLLSMLTGSLTSQSSVDSMSGKTGISSQQVSLLMSLALPLLIKYMMKNASSQDGASSLLGALTQHKSQKSAAQQIDEADADDGQKIISHIFGKDQNKIVKQFSGETGLSGDQVIQVLSHMAPALMSGVSAENEKKAQKAKNAGKAKGPEDILGSLFKLF